MIMMIGVPVHQPPSIPFHNAHKLNAIQFNRYDRCQNPFVVPNKLRNVHNVYDNEIVEISICQ